MAIVASFIVGALSLGVWFGRALLIRFLSTEHELSGVTIRPYGYQINGLLDHSFDSLFVETNGTTVKVVRPKLSATLLGEGKLVNLDMESLEANINTEGEKKESQQEQDLSISEKIRIPLPVKIKAKKAKVTLSDGKHWSATNISVENTGEKAIALRADNVQGDYVKSKAAVDIDADFSGTNLKASVLVQTADDEVKVSIDAPKNNLTQVKSKVNLMVEDPESWLPMEWPHGAPSLGALEVAADANVDVKTGKAKYKANIKTHLGERWPLMPLNASIDVEGNMDSIRIETTLRNNEGGSIYLKGAFDTKFNGTAKGRVDHMSAKFGPQMMPLDAEIHSFEKIGSKMEALVETRQGSIINSTIDVENGIVISYTGDLTPYEPWALDWVRGNVILTKNTKIYGFFDGNSMKAQVKFTDVPYAYHMKADSVHVNLDLTLEGIVFNRGQIYTPDETFDFDGDVFWGTKDPHTSWNLYQRTGGSGSVYITIDDSLTIDAKTDQAVIRTIPFADINISERINGTVTGHWFQNFDSNHGIAELNVEGNLDAFDLKANILARQNGDTIYIDQANADHNKNSVQLSGGFVLPNDSNPDFKPTATLPIQVLYANLSSHDFSIPLLLEPLNDSTLSTGMLNGELAYQAGQGLSGNLDFFDIEFNKINPDMFNIKKLNMFAQNEKVEINAYLDIGLGGWSGNTQIIFDHIFNDQRHVNITHGSDNGGSAWMEGFIDQDMIFKGTFDVNGSWYVPGSLSEITNTDLHADITADITKGLKGITAEIRSDSTVFQPAKMDISFPFFIRGTVQDGLVEIGEASTRNDKDEAVTATLQFDLDSMQLKAVDILSQSYTITLDEHTVRFENINGHLEDSEEELLITANIPKLTYGFSHDMFGEAEAHGRGDINFSIPHSQEGQVKNKTIGGNIIIDKMVYHKSIDIEVTPASIDRYLTMFNNFTTKLRKKGQQEAKISTASPVNLSLHISDSQNDSVMVVTPFATFPFTVDIWVLGSTTRPLLRGDISNTNSGFIGIRDLYEFELNSFQISWNDDAWQNGIIDVTSSQELHYCSETNENEAETCPINLDIQGTISNPQPVPSSNCGTEATTASIYYNVFLGCIADGGDESTDWNKLAGKAIGKVISATANKTLGGDYIGDIDMKVMIFDNTTTSDKDSSYFKVPISMDRWIKNMSLIFGYTQDQSDNPTYDQALQFGLNYTLPVFQEAEYSHQNHLNPTVSLNAMLIEKQYLTNTGTEGNENRVEKNIGINYSYRYWNPCLLGLGFCEDIDLENKEQENKK
ncbi:MULTISPECIES: hypothetical protein [unclassified Fibrobacter]|uniref:hypothetical protein n=1 Tax=unclassified Fibrobacter TaxID=2634177 RepID=UPI000D6BCDB6|nr:MULTISPECIES: hypothetical protein [unclassified Fibrobacter]PWJ68546.1 hypothetical protein BGX12_10772 [Fibrobacter sp. UWR4]PZW72062.1 hypothetical protein C8E88_100834 [Fibrobacter sp. UWR1]